MAYKLCYVDGNKVWFTSDIEHQWGDDWNDRPYEHNAGEPYDSYYENDTEYPINLRKIYFEVPNALIKEPCEGYTNSPYSVQDINNCKCPWLKIEDYDNSYEIYAGTNYAEFTKFITEELGGTIYTPKK